MSPKIDISLFRLRSINFDNAKDVRAVLELIDDNLSQQEFLEFKYRIAETESESLNPFSILVTYDEIPIAHVAFELDPEAQEVLLLAPVIDSKHEHMSHFVNSMIWRALNRLSKRQGWKYINFSTISYGDCPRLSAADFRACTFDILPGSITASLRERIEVVHGRVEIISTIPDENTFSSSMKIMSVK